MTVTSDAHGICIVMLDITQPEMLYKPKFEKTMAPFSDAAVRTARASKRGNYNVLARLRLTMEKKRCPTTLRRREWMRWEMWAATLGTDGRITLPEQLMEDLIVKQLRKLKAWMRTLPFQARVRAASTVRSWTRSARSSRARRRQSGQR